MCVDCGHSGAFHPGDAGGGRGGARTVTRPIPDLDQSVHQVREDNFDMVFPKVRNDEIGDLSDQFNKMVRHIKELMARIIAEQTTRRKYELLLLQAQIPPLPL